MRRQRRRERKEEAKETDRKKKQKEKEGKGGGDGGVLLSIFPKKAKQLLEPGLFISNERVDYTLLQLVIYIDQDVTSRETKKNRAKDNAYRPKDTSL